MELFEQSDNQLQLGNQGYEGLRFHSEEAYQEENIEEKCWALMSKDGQIAKDLIAVQNALKPENKDMTLIIKYNDLVNNPENEIKKVYKFLDIPYFNHNYNSLSQFNVNGIPYDDRIVGKNLHTIKTKIEKQPNVYRDKIPQSIINAYKHITL
jgi:sulfotransferase